MTHNCRGVGVGEGECNIPIIIPSLTNAYVDIICGYNQAMRYDNCISLFY
jgi:hypothetical protein